MWGDNNKLWMHYAGVLAADEQSARFLSRYIRFMAVNRTHLSALEIIDLQQYKIIKPSSRKLKQYINERLDTPFVFVHCRN